MVGAEDSYSQDVENHVLPAQVATFGVELSQMSRSKVAGYISPSGDEDDASLDRDRSSRIFGFASEAEADDKKRLVSRPSTTTVNTHKKRRLQGWRFGVAASAALATMVLLINLLFATIASTKSLVEGGIGTLFDGDCSYVEQASIWLHLAINILSSLLLSASNYTMQALCSPTRDEVDRAHAKGWILGLSSVPIHLLYNSAIFKTIDANLYQPTIVRPRFLDDESLNTQVIADSMKNYGGTYRDERITYLERTHEWFTANLGTPSVLRLSNADCMSAYGTNFVSGWSDVLLVTSFDGAPENQTVMLANRTLIPPGEVGYEWICAHRDYTPCDVAKVKSEADDWRMYDYKIDYCLAQVSPSHCKLQFSQAILITVVLMNATKAIAMVWTYYRQKTSTLVTIGDAIASFLAAPDPLTASRCLMARADVDGGPLAWQQRSGDGKHTPNVQPLPQTYRSNVRAKCFRGASTKRWAVTYSLLIIALLAVAALLGYGTNHEYIDTSVRPFQLGFGKVDPRLMIDTKLPTSGPSGLLASVLLANTPQAICSLLYLAYNGMFTCMLLCHEWSGYFLNPRPLRVTTPHGEQRSRYYLQLPFTYSVPLLAMSALLHWLISESIFLARIDYYQDRNLHESLSNTGYSPLAILLTLIVGLIALATLIAQGFRRFSSPMPAVGSCSVAIASACHRPSDDDDAAYLPVSWGEINHEGTEDVGHCAFTSQQTYEPVEGRMYAGSSCRHRCRSSN